MNFIVETDGTIRCLYEETLDLLRFGEVRIERGSHVEIVDQGRWFADLSPVDGPLLGPFSKRSDALAAETRWLNANWLHI